MVDMSHVTSLTHARAHAHNFSRAHTCVCVRENMRLGVCLCASVCVRQRLHFADMSRVCAQRECHVTREELGKGVVRFVVACVLAVSLKDDRACVD